MKKINKKGFATLELLVVVIVIAAIVGLALYTKNKMTDRTSQAYSAGIPVDPEYFPKGVTYGGSDGAGQDWQSSYKSCRAAAIKKYANIRPQNSTLTSKMQYYNSKLTEYIDKCVGTSSNNAFSKSKYAYQPILKSGPIDMRACRTSDKPSDPVKVRALWDNQNLQAEYEKYLAYVKASGAFWIKTNGAYQLVTDVPRSREVPAPKKVTDNPGTWKYIIEKSYASVNTTARLTFMRLPEGQLGGGPAQFPNASKKIFWDGGGYSESDLYSHMTGEFAGLIKNLKEHPQFRNDAEREQARIWYKSVTGKNQVSLSTTNPLAQFFISYQDLRTPEKKFVQKTKYLNFQSIPKCYK